MKIELQIYPDDSNWPRCYYDRNLYCGDRDTGVLESYVYDQEKRPKSSSWHVSDMCNCPSCPLRVAISSALHSYKKENND